MGCLFSLPDDLAFSAATGGWATSRLRCQCRFRTSEIKVQEKERRRTQSAHQTLQIVLPYQDVAEQVRQHQEIPEWTLVGVCDETELGVRSQGCATSI